MTNNLSLRKTNEVVFRQIYCHGNTVAMKNQDRPYTDIAEKLIWHREEIEKLTQSEYALQCGLKRAALNNWESGQFRLSLNAALKIRKRYGLSLDFLYEGNDDALPMTLRKAWRDRP